MYAEMRGFGLCFTLARGQCAERLERQLFESVRVVALFVKRIAAWFR
jgi:hypothetical protein